MPVIKSRGLRGLDGLGSLSKGEYDAFVDRNKELISAHNYDPVYINNLYSNKQFIDKFGVEAFKQVPDVNLRNLLYKDAVVGESFEKAFKDDKDYNILSSQLDTQGKLDLLNSAYMGTVERQRRLNEGIGAAKKVQRDYDVSSSSPFMDALGAGTMQVGKTSAGLQPYQQDEDFASKDKEIREQLFADTQKRREEEMQPNADLLYSNILNLDSEGKKSLTQSYEEFDKLATEASPYYATFKNSDWLKGYTHEDRLKDYAKYQALGSIYGEGVAKQYLDRSIQDRVAEAQDGRWTGNTLKKVLTTAWSDLGSNVAVLSHLGESVDRMAIWNQGKDPDKPIVDETGNIVDYGSNDNVLTNPDYWYDVYKYNTFSPSEIKVIEERGGVSEDVNVRKYGYVPDFLSWDTAEEGFSQVGHIVASVAETGLTGALGKAIGLSGKAMMKGLGLSAKAMNKASKVGAITNDLAVGAVSGLNGPQLESMGTFEEQLQAGKERIKEQIEHELREYSQTIDYNTQEAQAAIKGYYDQLKKADQRRMQNTKGEGTQAFPLDADLLMSQAKQQYTNQLLEAMQKELEELHKPDEQEAAKVAAKAYATNFLLDYIKEVPITTGIQKFKIAKGSMRGAFDNTVDKEIVEDAVTGGVKRAEKGARKAGSWMTKPIVGVRNFMDKHSTTKELLKQFGGGGADEYLDGINASFSQGMGNADFENYMNKVYDPKNYNDAVDTMLGNLLSGMSAGIDGLTDRENLYEGFIGMVAPLTSVMVNPNIAFSPHDTWNAVVNSVDAAGNKLTAGERLTKLLTNPLLNSYADVKEQGREIDSSIAAINSIVEANKDRLSSASKVLSTLNDYSSPLHQSRYKLGEGEDADVSPSLLDSQDQKLYNAFTLIDALNTLEAIPGSGKVQHYSDMMKTFEGLAEGTLSEEAMSNEIDEFLADEDNKSILDEGMERAREIAAGRLQKNAKYFMDMKTRMGEVNETFAKSSAMKNVDPRVKTILAYNLVASDDYKARLDRIEGELGVTKTNTDELYMPNLETMYGTTKSRQSAVDAREKTLSQYKEEQDEVQERIDKADKKIESLKKDFYRATTKEDRAKVKEDLRKQKNLAQSLRLQWNTIDQSKKKVGAEQSTLTRLLKGKENNAILLSEEEILNMDARDRYAILSEANRGNYSEEQQKVIQHTRENLLRKDPEVMTKLKDASTLATRLSDLKEMYARVLDNNPLASTYLDAMEEIRVREAYNMTIQKALDERNRLLDAAYVKREDSPQMLKEIALSTNSVVLESYMEDNPEKQEVFQPYLELSKYSDDIKGVIDHGEFADDQKKAMITTVVGDMLKHSNTSEEAYKYLEGIVDSKDLDENIKEAYNTLLAGMEKIGHQRDATILETRKARKQREEEEKKKLEEERKKQEEEKKRLAEEAELKAIETAKQQAEEERMAEINNHTPIVDGNAEPATTISKPNTVLGNEDLPKPNTPAIVELSEEEEAKLRTEKDVLDWSKMPSVLMSKDAEDSSVDAGTVWYGSSENPRQGTITATRKNDVITFSVGEGNKPYSITLSKEDWQYSQSHIVDGQERATGITDDFKAVLSDGEAVNLQDTPFDTSRVFKGKDGKWYAEGRFRTKNKAGLTENTDAIVELREGFDLDDAVNRHIANMENAYMVAGVDTGNPQVIMEGDEVMIKSLSLDEQAKESETSETSEMTTDVNFINTIEEQREETTAVTLSGNSMSEYEPAPLKEDGVLEHKKGKTPNDSMSRYYAWMKNAGIKLQNIIDEELGLILRRNPNAKVKFMTVRSQYNATKDADMRSHLMLVLDYDNGINKGITSIHNEDNGGVIESGGKKYLVIGTVGYGNQATARKSGKWALWNTLFSKNPRIVKDDSPVGYGLVLRGQKDFFDRNPSERFYVNPNLSTEIVPQSLIPGYRVRQLESDEEPKYRKISEVLADKARNPKGYDISTLAWGIQEYSKFLVTNVGLDKVMVPRDPNRNAGSAFVLIPAGNGKLLPAYLKPLFYMEMNDGVLKEKVDKLLSDVVAPKYETRFTAAMELGRIFHFDKDGNTILLRKLRDEMALVKDGKIFKTFVLGKGFDRQDFIKAFGDMNPRVNVTSTVLRNKDLIQQYDEAGALTTDIARLHTAGSSYSIYGVDTNGKMLQPVSVSDNPVNTASELRGSNSTQVPYKGLYYRETGGEYFLGKNLVSDPALVEQLKINKMVTEQSLLPVTKDGVWNFYSIGTADNPKVVKIDGNSKEVTTLSTKDAVDLLERIRQEELEEQRETESDRALEDFDVTKTSDIELGSEDDFVGGEEVSTAETGSVDKDIVETLEMEADFGLPSIRFEVLDYSQDMVDESAAFAGETQDFDTLMKDKRNFMRVVTLLRKKWKDAPTKTADMESYLREKGMDVDSIGKSAEAVEAWFKTLEDCR